MGKLAINGGKKVRDIPFPKQISVGEEEKEIVSQILNSKILSAYRGTWGPNFLGGEYIQELEKTFCERFDVGYAIACNSCTSALHIVCKALGLGKGKNVIVTPWSMSCSATAPLMFGATPIFSDIEYLHYCLDFDSIKETVTSCENRGAKIDAIIVVDLFGQPYDVENINAYAKEKGIVIIEDAAQAIGSTYGRKYAGTLGDVGVFSFTQGKILTSGEGGMITTNDSELAFKCRLIMNHAEAVLNEIEDRKETHFSSLSEEEHNSMLGFNLRMTEIQAGILLCQLKKLDSILYHRREMSKFFNRELFSFILGIFPARVRKNCTHSYYVQPFLWDESKLGISRDTFIDAVKAELSPESGREKEGVPIGCGYIKPLYRFPCFKSFLGSSYPRNGLFNVERLWKKELFLHRFCGLDLSRKDADQVIEAFYKVWKNRRELVGYNG